MRECFMSTESLGVDLSISIDGPRRLGSICKVKQISQETLQLPSTLATVDAHGYDRLPDAMPSASPVQDRKKESNGRRRFSSWAGAQPLDVDDCTHDGDPLAGYQCIVRLVLARFVRVAVKEMSSPRRLQAALLLRRPALPPDGKEGGLKGTAGADQGE
jgi:hypothetical protein